MPTGLFGCPDGRCPLGQTCDPKTRLCVAQRPAADPRGAAGRAAPEAGAGGAAGSVNAAAGSDGSRDPCQLGNGGCDALVSCTNYRGIASCGPCPDGFYDVLHDGTRCRDIDECATNQGGCDADRQECRNTLGGRECACKPGLHQNGPGQCSRNVPCVDPNACADQADCQTLQGLRLCQCRSGYEGDGGTCTDIDECARGLDHCGPRASCVNRPGGFDCVCPPGFEGPDCIDADECKTLRDDCDDQPDACVNNPGGYQCRCPAGYTGSGIGDSCVDIDECRINSDNCDYSPDACVNDVGGYHCSCPDGYRGLGVGASGCGDVDECAERTDNCDRDPGACLNAPGGFRCECPPGYMGSGVGADGCKPIDPCAANPCGAAGSCAPAGSAYRCDCACGYAALGSPVSCAPARSADVGYAGTYAGSTTAPADTIIAIRIGAVPAGVRLLRFGARAANSGERNVRMALYEDLNATAGQLIAQSAATRLSAAGTLEVMSGCPGLAASSYWLAVLADGPLQLSADAGVLVPTISMSVPFASGFPTILAGTVANGPLPSLSVAVQLP